MRYLIIILIFILAQNVYAENSAEADSLAKEAISLMNRQEFKKAIGLLEQSIEIDSASIVYPYELALCYYKLEKYEKAISLLEPLKDHPDSYEQIYQIIGNSYDFLAMKTDAIKTYIQGLEKFPNSGRLHMELGIAELGRDNDNLAIQYFEKGINVDPEYPNNYYRLANYYEENELYVFAYFYTEYFLNYTKNQNKFREMTKKIAVFFNKFVKYENGSFDVVKKNVESSSLLRPFENKTEKVINELFTQKIENFSIQEIYKIRSRFLKYWNEDNYSRKYYLGLFSYHDQLKKEGLFEAYNYWLMTDYNIDEFKMWFQGNHKQYDKILKWLRQNKLSTENLVKYIK